VVKVIDISEELAACVVNPNEKGNKFLQNIVNFYNLMYCGTQKTTMK
jgi:hypothetical protein